MSDGLTLVVSLSNIKDGATTLMKFSDTFTITNSPIASGVQSIGTSWEAIQLGEVTSPGYFCFKNLDATNYIELSADSGGANPLAKPKAGQFGVFPLAGTTLFARANTAACLLNYALLST